MAVATGLMIVIVSMWTIAFFLRYLFACGVHFDIWWTNAMRIMTECGDFNKILNWLAVTDFVCDMIILIMPLPSIWKLHLPWSQKAAVSLIFVLGGFAAVASLIRMIWVVWQSQQNFNPDLDATLLITTFLFWNLLEVTVGLLAACIPTLRSLVNTSSLDSVLRSVRSKLSLTSLRSFGSTQRHATVEDDGISLRIQNKRTSASDTRSDTSHREVLGLSTRTNTSATASVPLSGRKSFDEVP